MCMHLENEMIESKEVMSQSDDLISHLPRDIIETILGRLPLQEAVKTSILSKEWRYNWATITQLCFDLNFLNYITNNGSLEKIGFENIINSVFHLYRGQPLTFVLILPPERFFANSQSFDKWMLFLLKKGLKELTLYNLDPYKPLHEKHPKKLSSRFFSCKDLRFLHLSNFVFEPQPPPAFICFKNLITICFERLEIANDVFETIVSGAIQLQTLVVSDCKGLEHLNVDAPKLKKLDVEDDYKRISIGNMLDLEDVSFRFIDIDNFSCHGLSIECWSQLKNLELWVDSLQVFGADVATKLLPTKFHHLKYLTLFHIKFRAPSQFHYAVHLIKSSPNLQELEITSPSYEKGVVEPITKFMEVQDWGDCSLDRLQTVNMRSIEYVSPELLLLKNFFASHPFFK